MVAHWVILRTGSLQTLRLAEAINREGIAAWTPSQVARPRLPRRRCRVTLRKPLLPRFVFADASRLLELLELSHKPLAAFSVMSNGDDRYAVVHDAALEPLRWEEGQCERSRLRSVGSKPLKPGRRVALPRGAWEGLTGIVERSSRKITRIDLGRISVEVETWLLGNDDLEEARAA
jgi:hypothetical protein